MSTRSPSTALVVGMGVTGAALSAALRRRGCEVTAVDDHPSPASLARSESVGVTLAQAPPSEDTSAWDALASVEMVLASPGVAETHPSLAAAERTGALVSSELDLAALWDQRPVVAITGTNGKTTVTTLVTEALQRCGLSAVAAGNTDLPLVAAIDDPDTEIFVVEASSFRLGRSRHFRPAVATWLNFAPDHLDVHTSVESYEAAKARIWADMAPGATAVANAEDPNVMRHLPKTAATVTFGLDGSDSPGHWTIRDNRMVDGNGAEIVAVSELARSGPHDLRNGLAVAATAVLAGASLDAVRATLVDFTGLAHRLAPVGEHGEVRYFNDSKSTTPHATVAAVSGLDSVVLVAGGRNKGIDLSPLAQLSDRLVGVVAIGEAAEEVAAVFEGRSRVVTAGSMAEAVTAAAALASPGDVVLLSPACASFDSYSSYAERGDDFAREVQRLSRGEP